MGVIGDSLVTGALADPHLEAFYTELIGRLLNIDILNPGWPADPAAYPSPAEFHIQTPIEPVTRITHSTQEWARAKGIAATLKLTAESDAAQTIDVEEYSFAYMIGRALDLPGRRIVVAAQDGQKVSSISRQVRRLLDYGDGRLPPLLLVSYGLNDICHPDDINGDPALFQKNFLEVARAQLAALTAQTPAAGGTTIVIAAPPDATNLLINEDLLRQKIPFEGASLWRGSVTCKQILDDSDGPSLSLTGRQMRGMLVAECRGLREPTSDPQARAERARRLQEAQVEDWRQALSELGPTPELRWIFADSIRAIRFHAGDLANDCFHPSVAAHTKIARQFLSHELSGFGFH